ncbi:radical SAM protein [Phosphitispora sp. TUW77]|uniref:radical SAM protein n=1 Tax=Phosphitispora sp. TUW77 TaxID=3152361 RepID=UPI003AB87CD9
MFQLLYADSKGRMYEHPEALAVGRTGGLFAEIEEEEMIPLPEGASLVMVPGGVPVAIGANGSFNELTSAPDGAPCFAVGALLPQGFARTMLPAYRRKDKHPLPLFGYAAVGWKDGRVYVAAVQTDNLEKWNPSHYGTSELPGLVYDMLDRQGNNRVITQLAKCALEYNCFTAQNIFYRRWEGGIPVSPVCNARCLGCISLQPAECCPAPQSRIGFVPEMWEVTDIAVPHLIEAEGAIISFGQGCEGEPSLQAPLISEAIKNIRSYTGAGTINMNTNAGNTAGIKEICSAGIDSLRVSTISAREETYTGYYVPISYRWQDVYDSIAFARDKGTYVSLNLLIFPGLTDIPEEAEALVALLAKLDINMVQIRNLNIDPDFLSSRIPLASNEVMGINNFIDFLKAELPGLEIGNYSRPVRNNDI